MDEPRLDVDARTERARLVELFGIRLSRETASPKANLIADESSAAGHSALARQGRAGAAFRATSAGGTLRPGLTTH